MFETTTSIEYFLPSNPSYQMSRSHHACQWEDWQHTWLTANKRQLPRNPLPGQTHLLASGNPRELIPNLPSKADHATSWTSQWNDRSNLFSTGCSTQLHLSHSIRGTLGCKALCAARRRWWDQQGTSRGPRDVAMSCEGLVIISTFQYISRLKTRLLWSRVNMLSRHRLQASIFGFDYRSEMIWWNITSEISMYREISNNPAQTLKTLIWHEILSAQFDGLSRPSQKLWNKDPSIEKAWRSLSQVSGSEKKWNLSTKTTGVPQSYFSGERRLRMIPMLWPSTFCMISIHPQPKTSCPIHIRWDPIIHGRRCDALQTCILHPNWQLNTPWSMRMVAQFAKCADIRTPVNQCQSTKITMTCITKNKKEKHLRISNNQVALAERNAASAASRAMRTVQSLHLFKCKTLWPSWMVPLTINDFPKCPMFRDLFCIQGTDCSASCCCAALEGARLCVASGFYCNHFCQVPHWLISFKFHTYNINNMGTTWI